MRWSSYPSTQWFPRCAAATDPPPPSPAGARYGLLPAAVVVDPRWLGAGDQRGERLVDRVAEVPLTRVVEREDMPGRRDRDDRIVIAFHPDREQRVAQHGAEVGQRLGAGGNRHRIDHERPAAQVNA